MAERRDYRLPAFPKRTIREKSGSHGSLSNCKLDYTPEERRACAIREATKNRPIKEREDAWNQKMCEGKCQLAIDMKNGRLPTCNVQTKCSWARYIRTH